MLIIPSIDIKDGKVVNRIKYSDEFDEYYNELSENPIELCKLWRSENAKTLHINDLDGVPGSPNTKIILDILECLDIPITLSSTSGSIEDCELFLEKGIFRVALCQFLIENPDKAKKMIEIYSPNRIIFYAVSDEESLYLWGRNSGISLEDYFKLLKLVGATRLIFGNINWNESNIKPNFDLLKQIIDKTNLRITLNGGVYNYYHLKELQNFEKFGVDSLIISEPLYGNNFPCQEIWRIAETT
jgi:phosphoribosylformimino-5-aminoimidazole carboxamide ribonucleotide (ProFAR) isomerase